MNSNDIDALIKKRNLTQNNKGKYIQVFLGVCGILTIVIATIMLWKNQYNYAVCLVAGTLIGIVLRYSRFCFAAAFRDIFVSGSTRVMRGIILAMIVSTVGFAVIQSGYTHYKGTNYDLIPGAVSSVGVHVMIGAFIFGIGMVLAGGCASGVLMRIGEGHILHLVVLLGFIIGTLLGAKDYKFWYDHIIKGAKTIYFSEYLDIKIVAIIQIIVLGILYKIALNYEKNHFK
ncbi:YeeE/YedE thiosulfate transporter family protein [Haloimpatiens sp. FM7315]|uniref:YeeE/YedE thiosulfate transporter family protein n=1 Tax=Haloimpatiens sp. FM7315 TaxID=3298609 RepID=UPI0035A28474